MERNEGWHEDFEDVGIEEEIPLDLEEREAILRELAEDQIITKDNITENTMTITSEDFSNINELFSKLSSQFITCGKQFSTGLYILNQSTLVSIYEWVYYSDCWLDKDQLVQVAVRYYWKHNIGDIIHGDINLLKESLSRRGLI